jgi:membrane protein required for colicin V production
MIWADWFLLAALIVSVLIGVLRGFTREVLGLLSWILAIIAALAFAPHTVGWLEPHIATPSIRIAASYALVFFGVLVLGAIVTGIVSMLVRKSPLSSVDRMVGGGFGLLRGVVIALGMVWLVGMTPARQDPWWGQSALIPRLEGVARTFDRWLPDTWRQQLVPAAAVVKEGV